MMRRRSRGIDPGELRRKRERLNGKVYLKEPSSCSEAERREFEGLVREGFDGSDSSLPVRIRKAACLGFHRTRGGGLAGIGAIKAPDTVHTRFIFDEAGATADPAGYELELGWVYVIPGQREKGIATRLCSLLMARVPGSPVFATTRPGNDPMINVLSALGFSRVGEPFPRRGDELVLFLKS